MDEHNRNLEKHAVTLPAVVEKIIPSIHPRLPEKAQLAMEGADPLYRELRIENTLKDENGDAVSVKQGAHVDITIKAGPEATEPRETKK
jgi:hypothetical protein